MLAAVIPLIRLPRRFGVFDYAIAPEIDGLLSPGSLVLIPFRKKQIFGIVWNIAEKKLGLRNIAARVHEKPFLSTSQLSLLKTVSDWYGISLASAATLFMPPLQKKNIARLSLPEKITQMKLAGNKPIYHHYQTPWERSRCLKHALSGTTLILVPTVADIAEVLSALSRGQRKKIIIFHSNLTLKEQFSVWREVRTAQTPIVVIGTRSAVFLPFFELDTIIVDYEHDGNHKNLDQTPRFHAKDIAYELAHLHQAQIHLMSFSPSFESYYQVYKKKYNLCTPDSPGSSKQKWLKRKVELAAPKIIDMRDEKRAKNYSLFSYSAMDMIKATEEDVFIFINRLGFAASLSCRDCGFVPQCPSCNLPLIYHAKARQLQCHYCKKAIDMIVTCSRCQSTALDMHGIGTEAVEKEVRELMSGLDTHDIIRLDRETNSALPPGDKPTIVIGTEMALPHIRWQTTKLIIFLDIDKAMSLPEYSAVESAWHKVQLIEYHRLRDSAFLLQTFHPEHALFRSLAEPDRIYRTELSARKNFSYPPYAYITRYLYGHMDSQLAKNNPESAYENLQSILTNIQPEAILLYPLETQPKFFRGKYWYTMLAKLPYENWQKTLSALNQSIPDSWKIDPNPIHILQP